MFYPIWNYGLNVFGINYKINGFCLCGLNTLQCYYGLTQKVDQGKGVGYSRLIPCGA